MRAQEALRAAIQALREAAVEDAPRDARILLAHAMDLPGDRLTLHLADEMTEVQASTYDAAIAARAARQPVSQIIGQRLFWGQSFRVTRDTLDPRPETFAPDPSHARPWHRHRRDPAVLPEGDADGDRPWHRSFAGGPCRG